MKQGFFRHIVITLISTVSVLCFAVQNYSIITASESEKLVVGVLPDRCPVMYVDESGEQVGIAVDLLKQAANKAGYEIEIKIITEKDIKEALDNTAYDIVMPLGSATTSAKGRATIISDNLSEVPFTLVTEEKHPIHISSHLRIGMLRSLRSFAELVPQRYPNTDIVFYDDISESIKALRNGEVDALLDNSYVWSYVLQKPAYSNLHVQPGAILSIDYKAAVLDTPKGREIISRLNKGIARIDDTTREAIVLDYTTRRLYKYTLGDYWHMYGGIIILGSLLFYAILAIMIMRARAYRQKQDNRLREYIEIDKLTGAYTLAGFKKKVAELIKEYPENRYFIAYNNIVNFKFINDHFGMEAGDNLLKFWVKKSIDALTEEEAICRAVADRIVVFRKMDGQQTFYHDLADVIEPVSNFFVEVGNDYKAEIRSGIYVLTDEDYQNLNLEHILDCARVAEKKVIEKGNVNFEFYNLSHWEAEKQATDITSHLTPALKEGRIQVWYQPQVNFEKGIITGAEALCRWNHSDLGWISPGIFIPVLEKAGKIYELDSYIWDRVCQDLSRWNEEGKYRTVSVNVSRADIKANPNVQEHFRSLIDRYFLSPDQLHIEITENAFADDAKALIEVTKNLQKLGFTVEMDDFGSGYSSLHMLKEVPINRVKMDLNFLSDEGSKEKGKIIISNMIHMIDDLGMKLISEGVETEKQAEFLREKGCVEMQGYYFYKPVCVEEFENLCDKGVTT
ncbi:EAL domain-containing protein [Pseudobutyrivibrio xylanivorans]|uniref:EAL domain, c-di-GMP-specific phosphodiesterase class I (Or its enzymatically inactive variant) n=1 Tax=Pseudobutyrivibrio xylanivorans TaxID=185007 RepID=A0A1G5S1E0_PSEXY|nr:EAL domain-containing protein [Pseudobutyrivibrio xylanivorans]SCZ79947.1 EAL domain, c-di-GMP-specific phosphodiesterase class I (or its enzymatically inactive variant) [Pseudobutyrivibrio xylanivorans]